MTSSDTNTAGGQPAIWHQLWTLECAYWADVDLDSGLEAASFYTDDAVFDLGMDGARLVGRSEIADFYDRRRARGARTTAHLVHNFTVLAMSTPHVAGLALLLRQLHPHWSPMEVKSALMTTATTKDNKGKPMRRFGGTTATPLDFGAGHVVPNAAADPGLVYDSKSADWTAYLCAIGQPPVTTDGNDPCATARKTDPSDLNTPSIAVGDLAGKQTVTRTVTNVARTTGSYTPTLQTPPGYKATVSPGKLVVAPGASASYRVTLTRAHAPYGDWRFGDITWSDGHHKVRSPIALRSARIAAQDEVARHGATGGRPPSPRPNSG